MSQLKFAVVCLGFAQALLLFVPREYGGWIGVVTLVVAGTALAITAPINRGNDDDPTVFQAEPGPPRPSGSAQSRLSDPTSRGRHAASKDVVANDGTDSA